MREREHWQGEDRVGEAADLSHHLWNGSQERAVSPVPAGCTSLPQVHSSRCWLWSPFLLACQSHFSGFCQFFCYNEKETWLGEERKPFGTEAWESQPSQSPAGFLLCDLKCLLILARGDKWVCLPLQDGICLSPRVWFSVSSKCEFLASFG